MEYNLKIKNKVLVPKLLSIIAICIIIFIVWSEREVLFGCSLEDILIKYNEYASLIYFIICFLQPIVLPLPEPVTIMTGSLFLGRFNGATIGFLGTILGIISMFLFSRYASKSLLEKIIDYRKLEKFNKYIKKNETIIILLLFLFPILPDEAICVGAGVTKVNGYKFILIAIIAKLITAFTISYSINIL